MSQTKPLEPRPSYTSVLIGPVLVATLLAGIAWVVFREPRSQPKAVPSTHSEEPKAVVVAPPPAVETPAPDPEPEPIETPKPPRPDPARIAEAKAELASARRDRERAEARAEDSSKRLKTAQLELASAERSLKTLGTRVKDPSARISAARARGEVARAQRDKVQNDLVSLANRPRPRQKPLIDKSPVARPAHGEEHHFEIHRDRVAFINLPRLMDEVRLDAKVQLRMSSRVRPIGGQVGPVGDFAIEYEMVPDGLDMDLGPYGAQAQSISYSLSGWEIVPRQDLRGETMSQAMQPASDFSRALSVLHPDHDTITLWVYPDGFALYRQLRDFLHEHGYLVAARPLPDGTPIRGSPAGSVSAGQ